LLRQIILDGQGVINNNLEKLKENMELIV